MKIERYTESDESALLELMRCEGDEWACYHGDRYWERYRRALEESITYVVREEDRLCGFCRCRDDRGFGVYIYDLLVAAEARGKGYGRCLMERVCLDFPDDTVYVMSDVDVYYEKQGFRREGSIFEVCLKAERKPAPRP